MYSSDNCCMSYFTYLIHIHKSINTVAKLTFKVMCVTGIETSSMISQYTLGYLKLLTLVFGFTSDLGKNLGPTCIYWDINIAITYMY